METSFLWLHLFLSAIFLQTSFAFLEPHRRHAPPLARSQGSKRVAHTQRKAAAGERAAVPTVRVVCHPDSLEIVIKADMFGFGSPVDNDELRLGVEDNDSCKAAASPSGDEYRIVAGLIDCGTKHWITKDSLVYTNLLIYSPVASPYGLIRMDEAVVPIECHYERKYTLSSSSLIPSWVSFAYAQAAAETLNFDLRIMTSDWRYRKSSNVFYLGESINIEASVSVGHHVGLRVFLNNCVATLHPDMHSVPKYVFIKNGCLTDSQISGSRSHFLPRTQEDKLRLVIDAFRFHNEDVGQLYITCQLKAVPVNSAETPSKACTFANKRWQSADDNNYLCRYCQSRAGQTLSKLGPRGFGRPEESEAVWESGLKTNNGWEQDARLGPLLVSSTKHKSVLGKEHTPVVNKLSRLLPYGSQWRSRAIDRTDLQKEMFPLSTPDLVEGDDSDRSEADLNAEDRKYPDVEKALLPGLPSTSDVVEGNDKSETDIKDLEKELIPLLPSVPELLEDKDVDKALLPSPSSTPDVVEGNDINGTDLRDLENELLPGPPPDLEEKNDEGAADLTEGEEDEAAAPRDRTVLDLGDVSPTTQVKLDVTLLSNATTTEFNISDSNNPKR